MTLRALNRTTAAYSSTQLGAIDFLPAAPKDGKDKHKGNADKDKDKDTKGKAKGKGKKGKHGKAKACPAWGAGWSGDAWANPVREASPQGGAAQEGNANKRTRSASTKRCDRSAKAKAKLGNASANPAWADDGWDATTAWDPPVKH